jgi:hypothetical protein
VDISSAWKVTFPGLHKSVSEPTLTDWISDPATRHYSGEAVYSRDVTLPSAPAHPVYLEVSGGKPLPGAPNASTERGPLPEVLGRDGLPNPLITRTGPGMHAYYDPPIHEAALVTINGQPAGALWHPPYRLAVTEYLRPGVNHVEFQVFRSRPSLPDFWATSASLRKPNEPRQRETSVSGLPGPSLTERNDDTCDAGF